MVRLQIIMNEVELQQYRIVKPYRILFRKHRAFVGMSFSNEEIIFVYRSYEHELTGKKMPVNEVKYWETHLKSHSKALHALRSYTFRFSPFLVRRNEA